MVVIRTSRCSNSERQFVRTDRMAVIGPHLPARMRGRQRIDAHVQNVWNFNRTIFPFNTVSDWHLSHAEIFATQGRRHLPDRSPAPPLKIAPKASVCLSLAR